VAAPVGVLLLNLGGPAGSDDVAPFLRSLLGDPTVTGLPRPFSLWLARVIAARRAPMVVERYRAIGGGSPLGRLTAAQGAALGERLGERFVVRHAFRHSAPRADAELTALCQVGVREVVAVPLYPQWSASTSGSALAEVRRLVRRHGLELREASSFAAAPGFIDAVAARLAEVMVPGDHVIVAAHGLPERAVRAGDPYVSQVRATVAALATRVPAGTALHLAFQSRLGPVAWTRPYLDEEVRRLGGAGVRSLVVVPVSFVAENLETLHELDIELADTAAQAGITRFRRAATVGCHPAFVAMLAGLVVDALGRGGEVRNVA
jgi:protoporphyrin/coproporphyrin ferrochelatase